MAELRERDNKKKTYALEPTTNGGTEPLQKKVPLDGDGVSVEGGKGVKLKRQVGLISGIALIVGTMIGSGIFVSPKGVLTQTESVGMSLIVWLLCGLLSVMGALCYAELGTMVPKSGAEYAYLMAAVGPIPAYLFAWTSTIVIKPSSLSIIALSFGAYVSEPFFDSDCGPPVAAVKLFAILAILLIVFINCASVKWATAVQNFFTAAKLIALVIIIIVGFIKLFQGNIQYLTPSTAFAGSSGNVFAYGIAFYQGLWAYDGWNQLNYITEELINPYRNLPLAIIIGIPLVTGLYILVNIAYFTVMSPEELLQSGAVAVTLAQRSLGPTMAWIIPFFVCCSTFGAINGSTFTAGRLTFVAAREGHMVEILSMVHVKRYTPFPALVFQSLIAILMLLPGDFESLVNYFSFAAWMFYGGTVLALLVLRYRHPDWHRPIKVPILIPIIVLIASVYLVIAPIIDEPALEYLFAFLFILAGLLFYVPFVHYKYEPPFMKHITVFLQLLLEVAPTSYFEPGDEEPEA
ncbi:b(0,+)-type amino acid transporter 1-like isoform X1 [Asterias rubens]|uniref:b(0,+)-type amino acid transporter 1-like isoform X1 n=1 Tax=Asterias rubens TaxID=7604 RepID=UPI001455C57D|nr:b(0,+)-type amino acid transporter 1-like isoform X1 [Asterias rubens]XP_033625642.1 b(0,+)-type amino acid transporter 1-like isoform X1 [Asterias rubens]XP_033625643.1 b(0,+)-type amino acid transporter 1-like isoform X1 [Asterias rubens]XP_033625644.1 b(0,+)-type amino acid transporter 1-like isoform X1 [Asterias rubens]XP_033625646.1 b(0,+)-type amino acid transporter 1-like isoform X1 [Asterias rubens]